MSNYVSITELTPEKHDDYPDISGSGLPLLWDMEFPEKVDAERIVVNMTRLKHIHRLGAVSASFVEDYDGTATESDGAGGEAEEAELSAGRCLDLFDGFTNMPLGKLNLNATFGRSAITHQLNEPELSRRAGKLTEQGEVSAEKVWADLYDEAMRGSMREGAHRHLMGRGENIPGLYAFLNRASVAGLVFVPAAFAGLASADLAVTCGIIYGAAQIGPQTVDESDRVKEGQELKRRWSLMPANAQPDRYLVVKMLSKMPDLITVAE